MMRWFAEAISIIRDAGAGYQRHKAPRLGAAIAFYTLLSLSPLLLFVLAIVGSIFGQDAARGEIHSQITSLVGPEGAKAVEAMVADTQKPAAGFLATTIGILTLIFGATGVFVELQDALDTVWDVRPDPTQSTILTMIRDRILSFSIVCGMAFLLLVSLLFSAILSTTQGMIAGWLPDFQGIVNVINMGISFLLTAAMFAMIFKRLPTANPPWSVVWLGAGVTAILFTVGKEVIGLYLGRTAVGSAYGAAGSLVVLLVWIYYSTQILLFGAEITRVISHRKTQSLSQPDHALPTDSPNENGRSAPLRPGD
jgi:membrane protein